MKKLLMLVLLSGCILAPYRQEGLAIARKKTQDACNNLRDAVVILNTLGTEITKADLENREPNILPLIRGIATPLLAANDNLQEVGKTIVVLQEDIGETETDISTWSNAQIALWRIKYQAIAKLYKSAMSIISSKLPFASGALSAKRPAPWSATDISALVMSVLTAMGGGGLGAAKILNLKKRATEGSMLADALKEKCNGDGEFAGIIASAPTIARQHQITKMKGTT